MIAALVVAATIITSSQGPTPRPTVAGSPPQKATSSKQQPSDSSAAPAKPTPPPPRNAIRPEVPASDTNRAAPKHDPRAPVVDFNERIARYTFWLVIVGGAQVLAMIAQAIFLILTLNATGKAADAAASAADAAQKQVAHMGDQTPAIKASAEAAMQSAAATGRMLDTMDRPWLSIEPRVLEFTFHSGGALHITYWILVKNVGRAVANDVRLRSETIFVHPSGQERRALLTETHMALIESGDDDAALRFSVFPDEVMPVPIVHLYMRKQFESSIFIRPDGRPRVDPTFVAVALYRYPTSDRRHVTRIAHTIRRAHVPNDADPLELPVVGSGLKEDEIFLLPDLSGGSEAD